LTSELGQQSRLVKLLDENLQQTSQQTFALEYRLSNLEHERDTSQRSTRMAFESLGARVTELGIEVAELPTAKEIKDTWSQLERSLATLEQNIRTDMDGRNEALDQELKSTEVRLEARNSGLQQDTAGIRKDVDGCRQDIASLLRHLWGDDLPLRAVCDEPPPSQAEFQTPTEPTTLAVGPKPEEPAAQYRAAAAGMPLVPRIRQAEERLSAVDDSRKANYEDILQRIELKARKSL
ncbi:unnamed protein product, partial [Symbiodinium sp. KB8]